MFVFMQVEVKHRLYYTERYIEEPSWNLRSGKADYRDLHIRSKGYIFMKIIHEFNVNKFGRKKKRSQE